MPRYVSTNLAQSIVKAVIEAGLSHVACGIGLGAGHSVCTSVPRRQPIRMEPLHLDWQVTVSHVATSLLQRA